MIEPGELLESFEGSAEFHSVICRVCFRAVFFHKERPVSLAYQKSPAPRTRISMTAAIGIDFNFSHTQW
jgi:hypothetical protein